MTKKTFNQNWFCRVQTLHGDNLLIGYDRLVIGLGSKADKVFAYLSNPPRYAERPNGNVVVKPYHGVTLTFIAK